MDDLGLTEFANKKISELSVGKNAVSQLVLNFLALVPTLFLMSRLQVWMPSVTVISYVP